MTGWGSTYDEIDFIQISTSGIQYLYSGEEELLSGVWRTLLFNDGATLAAGTYGILDNWDSGSGAIDTLIKNATGMTTLSGVTINGPLSINISTGAITSTSGDSPGYFGPVLFF
jgi:hypothetical protein